MEHALIVHRYKGGASSRERKRTFDETAIFLTDENGEQPKIELLGSPAMENAHTV